MSCFVWKIQCFFSSFKPFLTTTNIFTKYSLYRCLFNQQSNIVKQPGDDWNVFCAKTPVVFNLFLIFFFHDLLWIWCFLKLFLLMLSRECFRAWCWQKQNNDKTKTHKKRVKQKTIENHEPNWSENYSTTEPPLLNDAVTIATDRLSGNNFCVQSSSSHTET